MRFLTNFIRSAPITFAAIIVAIAAVAILILVHMSGKSFVEDMRNTEQVLRKIDALGRESVRIPPEQPDQPEREVVNIAINQAAIDALTRTYRLMGREYDDIFAFANSQNQMGHRPMLDGLLPEARNGAVVFDAKEAYRRAFLAMMDEAAPSVEEPRLDAGMPLPAQTIAVELKRLELDYLTNKFFPPKKSVEELNAQEKQVLTKLMASKLLEMQKNNAMQIHLYAQTDIRLDDFPFDVGEWANRGAAAAPEQYQIWEGQMGLWIQQDIAQVIAMTNQTHEPTANVMNMPIKQLLKVEVVPGYVGLLDAVGGLVTDTGSTKKAPAPTSTSLSALAADKAKKNAPAVGSAPAAVATTASADKPLPDAFELSPTGRRSNSLYDVRHVRVSMVIESQRMPEFFNNLSQVNFMTVLQSEVKDIDEYDALGAGYIFGTKDCVQLDVLIETIWLRQWTKELMPQTVRASLGVVDAAAPATTPGVTPGAPAAPGAAAKPAGTTE